MRKKIVWMVVSCLMVLSLVMASCGSGKEEEEEVEVGEEEVVITGEEEEVEEEVEEAAPEGPQYGGVISIVTSSSPPTFDDAAGGNPMGAYTLVLTNEMLIMGDWAKGAAGTNEAEWAYGSIRNWDIHTGCIAESWELTSTTTVIFHIRQGVYYALNPDSEASRLVGGRELTAYDVATCLNNQKANPRTNVGMSDSRHATITAPDRWTVQIELPEEYFTWAIVYAGMSHITPPEPTEKYGDMSDWRNSVGAGPFMLTDYVADSVVTLERNPNYWDTDPIGPGKGNQLPYLDGVKFVIISDASSQMAALRTAKTDVLHFITWENFDSLRQTTPDLLYKKYYRNANYNVYMRTDKVELPFHDVNVRRALMMATDFETIRDEYFGGDAQILSWPLIYCKEYADAYLPLEETPASVQELYVYNPEKAKQLLTDAGYPDGFKYKIDCRSDPPTIDYLSILADMWSDVDVDLVINPLETGAYTTASLFRKYEEMLCGGTTPPGTAFQAYEWQGTNANGNRSCVNDPLADEAKAELGRLEAIDFEECSRVHKEFMKYALDQAWVIPSPCPPGYHMWWPWLKNYHGEQAVGMEGGYAYPRWVWIDQNLKKSMGY
jgi:peptide/nickel transport system substrate-binding protein